MVRSHRRAVSMIRRRRRHHQRSCSRLSSWGGLNDEPIGRTEAKIKVEVDVKVETTTTTTESNHSLKTFQEQIWAAAILLVKRERDEEKAKTICVSCSFIRSNKSLDLEAMQTTTKRARKPSLADSHKFARPTIYQDSRTFDAASTSSMPPFLPLLLIWVINFTLVEDC